jgi:hypothetical protein
VGARVRPGDAPGLLERALTEAGDAYAPFPPAAVVSQLTATLCLGWTATERPPFPPSPSQGPTCRARARWA